MKVHTGQINNRRMKALLRLESQLEGNRVLVEKGADEYQLLDAQSVLRIRGEIATLRGKITSPEVARSIHPKKYRGVR